MTPLRIGIQGAEGCYHDAAAREYFAAHGRDTDIATVPFDSFGLLFEAMAHDASMLGAVAIENTIAGPLLQNHELLRQSALTIVGEHKMRISHVLAALPGQNIEDIREVHSHPMALMQCEQYLHAHPHMRMIESFDTAGSAREIAETQSTGCAAICGEYAAQLYGLDILARGIETNKRNFTRFLILADPLVADELRPRDGDIDKASVAFTLPHTQGALSKVLTILSFYDINLSKIQSTPIIGREWEYRFYVDVTFDSYARYCSAIAAVRPLISDFRTLGTYKSTENDF
ncbi:MAG: prephenate dehydratase [Muribaculaceae bacterium]|nr:prephenate dehydratase [Muribaculaceae bacterium]